MKRIFFLSLLLTLLSGPLMSQPQIVAHRGHWRLEGSAQNSLTSLRRAAELGLYGSEFDVWITSDGVPVVFHDAVIEGKRIEDTSYPELMNCRLGNGEFLPTLQQYLQLGKTFPWMKMIFEIKSHRSDEHNLRVVKASLDVVRMLGMERQTEFIAFSRFVCEQLHALSPKSKVAYLSGDLAPAEIKKMGLTGIDYAFPVFDKHPEWVEQAKRLGLEVNVWTVDGEEGLKKFAHIKGIDLITTNDPQILQKILEEM